MDGVAEQGYGKRGRAGHTPRRAGRCVSGSISARSRFRFSDGPKQSERFPSHGVEQ
jgi:hypothetical protein